MTLALETRSVSKGVWRRLSTQNPSHTLRLTLSTRRTREDQQRPS